MRKAKFWIAVGFLCCALLFLRDDCFALLPLAGQSLLPIGQRGLAGGLAGEEKPFNGSIDFTRKNFVFNFDFKDAGAIEVKGSLTVTGEYNFNLSLKHLKLGATDILTDFYIKGIISRFEDGRIKFLKGSAWTERSLINYKPLQEFQLGYEMEGNNFKINSFSWAELFLKGAVNWESGLNFDLDLTADNADIKNTINFLGIGAGKFDSEGKVSGNFKISRPPKTRAVAPI